MKIIVAEKTSPAAIKLFREESDWTVITADQLNGDLPAQLKDADALVVRSAVNVDAKLLEHATKLRVIGRAGVGVDNIDLEAATKKGIVVMNTPGANAVAVAEHTLAMMLALARHLSRADVTTRAGKWEKKSLQGTELRGKSLGVIGIGRIGMEVAKRARAFDYISLHLGVTPQTEKMINESAMSAMKRGVRIVNCARGELIDDAALAAALNSGQVGGAALDVFTEEPPKSSPLLECENLLATPHIAGSTNEAQEAVGVQIAQQVKEYLKRGVIQNAVNVPSLTDEEYAEVQPYIVLAEKLGSFLAQVAEGEGNLEEITLRYSGGIAEWKTALVRNAAIKGILNQSSPDQANLVNATSLAAERGIRIHESKKPQVSGGSAVNVLGLTLKTGAREREAKGTVLHGSSNRLLVLDGIDIEAPLDRNLVYMRNRDVPGVIGQVGTIMGKHGVNIANFSLGRGEKVSATKAVEAIAVIHVDGEVPAAAIAELRKVDAVTEVRQVRL